MKNILFVLITLCFIFIFLTGFTNTKNDNKDFGSFTIENIKKGKFVLACEDAQEFGRLVVAINNGLASNLPDNNTIKAETYKTQETEKINAFSNKLVNFLKSYYKNDTVKMQNVFAYINTDIYSNITLVSFLVNMNKITQKEFDDYIKIEYCGVTPPKTYISPKDISINMMQNINEVLDSTDNSSK